MEGRGNRWAGKSVRNYLKGPSTLTPRANINAKRKKIIPKEGGNEEKKVTKCVGNHVIIKKAV